ncbi:redoxin domain-containing protein [Macellibacteroides fermentans]|uniref:redoxin domain-containing protein n=1 Tax=Macellibacteroides fermentans TaxID=879969 RepID=UPI003B93ED01
MIARFTALICLTITVLTSCQKSPSELFVLEGQVENLKDSTTIELAYYSMINNKWQRTIDSAIVIDGKFRFEGKIEELTAAQLYFPDNAAARIYMEPTKMELWIDRNAPYAYKLSGTKVEIENRDLRKYTGPIDKNIFQNLTSTLNEIKQYNLLKENAPDRDSLKNVINNHFTEINIYKGAKDSVLYNFISQHPSYQIAPDLLYLLLEQGTFDVDTIKPLYSNLPTPIKNSIMGKFTADKIKEEENKKNSSVGGIAPDFTRESFSGKSIRLSDFRNKNYVLLDFWASWCIPCLKEIPNVKKLYGKYQSKGLEVIGVSLDDDKSSWLEAVNKQNLNEWPQILSKEQQDKSVFEKDDLSEIYNFDGIPFYVLIDKNGKVIERWEHIGEEQQLKLSNIFK